MHTRETIFTLGNPIMGKIQNHFQKRNSSYLIRHTPIPKVKVGLPLQVNLANLIQQFSLLINPKILPSTFALEIEISITSTAS